MRQLARLLREGYALNADGRTDAAATLDAAGSGRLVDRETINYDMIEEILEGTSRDWYEMVIREGKTFDFDAAIRALAAAIGDTDE